MRILGIDPGLRSTGFGVIEIRDRQLLYLACGCLRTQGKSLPQRLGTLFTEMSQVVETYQPQAVAAEIVFVNTNPHTSLLLGQARGALLCAVLARQIPIAEFTALQIKKALVGQGKAAKGQVSAMVCRLLNLPQPPAADAADALACAICHAHHLTSAMPAASASPLLRRRRHSRWRALP